MSKAMCPVALKMLALNASVQLKGWNLHRKWPSERKEHGQHRAARNRAGMFVGGYVVRFCKLSQVSEVREVSQVIEVPLQKGSGHKASNPQGFSVLHNEL